MPYDQFYQKVVNEARKRLHTRTGEWMPVCTNQISDAYPDFEEAVEMTIMETEYWDGPF